MEMVRKEEMVDIDNQYHNTIFWLSKAMWQIVEQQWQEYLKEYDLTINEYSVLFVLNKNKKSHVTEMSKLGIMHISTALNNSQNLSKRGYVQLEKDAIDTRATIVSITQKGEELLKEMEHQFDVTRCTLHKSISKIKQISGFKPQFSDVKSLIYSAFGHELFELLD